MLQDRHVGGMPFVPKHVMRTRFHRHGQIAMLLARSKVTEAT